MPSYTLGDIMSQATLRAGRRADLSASQVSFFANEAYMEVAALAPGALSEVTTFLSFRSGSEVTALPSDFFEPILLSTRSGGSHLTMAEASREQIDSYGTGTGRPTLYVSYASHLEVRPVPNSHWTALFRYRKRLSDMTETSNVPSLSTEWRYAILLKTKEKIYDATGNVTGLALARQDYLSYVQSLPTDEGRKQMGDTPRGVRLLY